MVPSASSGSGGVVAVDGEPGTVVDVVMPVEYLESLNEFNPDSSLFDGSDVKLSQPLLVAVTSETIDESDGPTLHSLKNLYISRLPWGPSRS